MDSKAYQSWKENIYRPVTERERGDFATSSGFPVEPVYGPWDLEGSGEDAGLPGQYPFTRGIYPSMYRGRLWTMRQYAGFSTAQESNRRYRYLLEQGQTGLSVAFDLPTQIGYDSDDPMALGEVGKVGVAIDTLGDMETLLAGIPLHRVSVSMTINATACTLLAMVLAVARRQGVAWESLSGTVQNDILKEYIARGTYRFPPRPSLRLITDIFGFCARQVPKWNTISISGYHRRVPLRSRRLHSPLQTHANTCARRSRPASGSTSSDPGYRSSSTRTTTFLRRLPSSVRPDGCGHG